MTVLQFTVPGAPQSKQRPKVTVRGNYAHAYTPKETVIYENYVRLVYIQSCGRTQNNGAIRADITAYFPIPKSTSKKKTALMESGAIEYTKKPDADNIAKSILDALNGIAYADDSQVCDLVVKKKYSVNPRVEVTLTLLGG